MGAPLGVKYVMCHSTSELTFRNDRPIRRTGGFTLVELLVALVVSLMLLGAVVSLFGFLGDSINDARAGAEQMHKIRLVGEMLARDLENRTAVVDPDKAGPGYVEYVEGPARDFSSGDSLHGDLDDVLALTSKSNTRPFTGRFANVASVGGSGGEVPAIVGSGGTDPPSPAGPFDDDTIPGFGGESRTAEILWFITEDPNRPGTYRLHRYQLMVAPGADLSGVAAADYTNGNYYLANDISARLEGSVVIANSLEDLTLRHLRRGHDDGLEVSPLTPARISDLDVAGSLASKLQLAARLEETIVLDNLLSFDIKVWDPGAPVLNVYVGSAAQQVELMPGDAGYQAALGDPTLIAKYGAYVDLFNYAPGYTPAAGVIAPSFNHAGDPRSSLASGTGGTPTVISLNADAANSSTPAGSSSVANTLNDSFAYDPFDPTGTSPVMVWTGGGDHFHGAQSEGTDSILSYTLSSPFTATAEKPTVVVDLWGRDQCCPERDNDVDVILYYGDYSTVVDAVTGIMIVDSFPQYARATFSLPVGITFDRMQIIGHDTTTTANNLFTLSETRVAALPIRPATYDTWSRLYSWSATVGFDADGSGVIGDANDVTVAPPYSEPLKGIQIDIRAYEPSSRSVRSVTIRQSFDQ